MRASAAVFGERQPGRSLRRSTAAVAALIVVALIAASPAAAASPTVTINQAAGQSDPTSGSTIEFTATFSAPVTGFDGPDVDLSGSTAAGTLIATVTGTGALYTVTVTGMSGPGIVMLSIPVGAAQNAASESSLASTSTDNMVTWAEPPPPTVTINQASDQADPSPAPSLRFTAIFSAPVTGFTAADVDLSSSTALGTLVATVTGGPTVYTVTVTGMTGTGRVVASIPAGAAQDEGHPSKASTSTDNSITWDPNAPLPTTPIDTPVGQPAPNDQSSPSSPAQSLSTPTAAAAARATPSLHLLSPCAARHRCATSRSGRLLPLRVSCGPAAPCAGTLTIALGHKTLGKLRFQLAAGATAKLRVPLRHSAAPLLAARPRIAAKLEITLGSASTSRSLSFALPTSARQRP